MTSVLVVDFVVVVVGFTASTCIVVVVGFTASTVMVNEELVPAIYSDRVMTAMYVHLVWSIRSFHTFVYENQMQCSHHNSNLWESNNMFELTGFLNYEYP